LLGGILALQKNELEVAKDFFKLAADYSSESFQESGSFKEKALVSRLRVLCALYAEKASQSHEDAQLQCKKILDELVASSEVKKAIDKEIMSRKGFFPTPTLTTSCLVHPMTSPKILSELASIIHFAEEQSHSLYNIPAQAEKNVDLHNVQAKLNGHKKRVTTIAAHSKYMFSGAKDNAIKVWDINTLKLKATLRGHKGAITCLNVVDDLLYSGSTDGTVRVWSISTLKPRVSSGTLLSEFTVRSLAIDRASNSLFVGCNDGAVRVLDAVTLTSKGSMKGHSNWVSCMAVHNGLLLSGSVDAAIKVWDISTLMCVGTLLGHSGFITSLSVSEDRLFSGSFDKMLKVWDLNTLTEVTAPALEQHDSIVRSLAVTNNKLYVGYASDHIRVINLSSLKEIGNIQAKPTSFDNCMTVSDGKLFIGSAGKTIHVHLI